MPHQQLWIRLALTAAVATFVLNGTKQISDNSDPNGKVCSTIESVITCGIGSYSRRSVMRIDPRFTTSNANFFVAANRASAHA